MRFLPAVDERERERITNFIEYYRSVELLSIQSGKAFDKTLKGMKVVFSAEGGQEIDSVRKTLGPRLDSHPQTGQNQLITKPTYLLRE
jgi:hypothetical protein